MKMNIDHKSWDLAADDTDLHVNEPIELYKHKGKELLELVRKWAGDSFKNATVLKTDLMEESLRNDDTLFDLAPLAGKAFGMDISPKLTLLAKQRSEELSRDINFLACDARYLSFKDNSFDIIISNSTLDHVPEIELGMRECFRVLKPGGIMVISIHNKLDLTFCLFHALKKFLNFRPHWYFDRTYMPWDIRDRLIKSGFEVEDFSTTTHIPMGLWCFLFSVYVLAEERSPFLARRIAKVIAFIIILLEKLEKRNTALNYFIGMLIAFKVRKRE